MLSKVRIKSAEEPLFDQAWRLYEESFPEFERRDIEYQKETLKIEKYHAEVILDQGRFIGIIFWWDFETMRFIEHLATDTNVRGEGYGTKIVTQFMQEANSPIILEVEKPQNQINRRRVAFYERLGFILNNHKYWQPSFNAKCDTKVPLLLMSHPKPLAKEQVEQFVAKNHPEIFFNRKW